ncbi:helix-turn-helix transcriptional regulator [Sulfitobacter dubius]|uniref:helix-turn-helix domain-containing protein n=1 Tax=Sulfitobacter dubius TaxID=218673 RepID=UPI0030D7D72E|tara:strand:- start:599 stop:853 length:255 start_codon:yes stop_codon:yes gene_type:complete
MTEQQKQHGATLRAIRLQCTPRLKQGDVANMLGVLQSTISGIETGTRRLSVPMLKAAADVLATRSRMTTEEIVLAVVLGFEVEQ